jgi:transitional endoplasmic reticulum ATPase
MATKTNSTINVAVEETQQELTKQALAHLAVIGGRMTRDDEVTFEGKKFIFPEQFKGNLNDMLRFVQRYVEGQQEEIIVQRTFSYRPFDGAYAVHECLKQYFGYAQSKARMGMFGKEPPQEVTIPVGYFEGQLKSITVPWGDMVLPGLANATLTITKTPDAERGMLLHLSSRCRRVEKEIIEGFYKVVEDFLAESSIYKGRAVYGNMEFIDTDRIDPNLFVYTEQVWADAETLIFSPMRDAELIDAKGLERKRVFLLEGPYGTGKSGLGRTSAKVAVANGWTAIIARPGLDDPFEVLKTARLYQPAMVFIEDVDTFGDNKSDPNYTTKLLDAFDGFSVKDLQMILVLTTNHAEKIHKGMLRPGRIHGVISIGSMDRPGVEKLARVVIGDNLEDDVDFDKVFEAADGYMPAFIKEGFERAVRYSIARLREIGRINTDDIVHALNSLRAQEDLQKRANDQKVELPALDTILRGYIQNGIDPQALSQIVDNGIVARIDGANLFKPNGDHMAVVRTDG